MYPKLIASSLHNFRLRKDVIGILHFGIAGDTRISKVINKVFPECFKYYEKNKTGEWERNTILPRIIPKNIFVVLIQI